MFAAKQAQMPDIRDVDSKEAFLYQAIYQKAAADILHTFETKADDIQRGLNRP